MQILLSVILGLVLFSYMMYVGMSSNNNVPLTPMMLDDILVNQSALINSIESYHMSNKEFPNELNWEEDLLKFGYLKPINKGYKIEYHNDGAIYTCIYFSNADEKLYTQLLNSKIIENNSYSISELCGNFNTSIVTDFSNLIITKKIKG